jgi:hypothetical protein
MGDVASFFADLVRFLFAVVGQTFALMTGVVAWLIAWALKRKNKTLPSRWLVIVGGACVFIACFLAWQEEHRNVVTEQDKNLPRLHGEIESAIIGITPQGATDLLVFVKLRNFGAPSIADNFQVFIRPGDGQPQVEGRIEVHLNERNQLTITNAQAKEFYVLELSDMLQEKMSKPLQRGDAVEGWINCSFSGTNIFKALAKTPLIIYFSDVHGKRIGATNTSPMKHYEGRQYRPGFKNPRQLP